MRVRNVQEAERREDMIEACMTLGLLGVCSIEDVRRKKVGVYQAVCDRNSGNTGHLLRGTIGIYSILGGAAVGMALLVLGRIFQGSIGYGDGLVLIDTGILLGAPDNLELFFTALFFAGIFALVSCVFFHKKRKDTFPFVPFLLIAYVGMLLWG